MTRFVAAVFATFADLLRKGLAPILVVSAIFFVANIAILLPEALFGLTKYRVVYYFAVSFLLCVHWFAVTEISLLKAVEQPVAIFRVLRNSLVGFRAAYLPATIVWFFIAHSIIYTQVATWFLSAGTLGVIVPILIRDGVGADKVWPASLALAKGRWWAVAGVNLGLMVWIGAAWKMDHLLIDTSGPFSWGDQDLPIPLSTAIQGAAFRQGVMMCLPVINAATYVVLRAEKGEPLKAAVEQVFE